MSFLDKFNIGFWNVGVIEKTVNQLLDGEEYSIRWMKHKYRDRFFADPFLLSVDEEFYYILAEEFPFYAPVGRIVKLQVNKKTMRLVEREIVISENYHLSYPFVYNNQIIPEAYRCGKCYSYDIKNLEKQEVAPYGLIDQTFVEYNGYEWIFATDKDNPLAGLKIFYKKPEASEWQEHKLNPVKVDIKTARPGGHFFSLDGNLYRPAQDSEKIYGESIRIMRVDKLNEHEFVETEVFQLSSKNCPPYSMGVHTFNVEKDFIIVDGYKEKRSFFIKPLCLKSKRLMRYFGEKK